MLLGEAGADVVNLPTIEIADPETFADIDLAVKKLAEGLYVWVVFTSANGLEKFFARLDACGYDARAFARTKIAAVGSVTAELLAERGIRADFVPASFTSEALAGSMDRGVGRVLLPRVADGPRDIVDLLRSAGWTPEECITYRNVPASPTEGAIERVRSGNFDVVTFASASAVRSFVALVGESGALGLGEGEDAGTGSVACIGPKTAAAATELGLRVDVVAGEHTGRGLRDALVAHFTAPEAEAEQPEDGTMAE
jgi:uroporphyrinogen-III synthase